jgi:DNA-binding HxlR family transcriptional regulator/peroxiredoxin
MRKEDRVRYSEAVTDSDCAIAQSLDVLGDWWTLLILRDVAEGVTKFNELASELGISRKVLTQRLHELVGHGVLKRHPYTDRPPRFEYRLTDKGYGLLPVLIALQDWGSRFVLGDGTLTGTSTPTSVETRRVQKLLGRAIPQANLMGPLNRPVDPVAISPWTVLYFFASARGPAGGAYPPDWQAVPGAAGCTVESTTFRDWLPDFVRRSASVRGISTQRVDELDDFAAHQGIGFPLLSDESLHLTAALRLPTFRAGGVDRFKRLTLLVDANREVRSVFYPITDPVASVHEVLHRLDELQQAA